jgi:hypothetical protein
MKHLLYRYAPALLLLALVITTASAKENDEVPVQAQWRHGELVIANRQNFANELELANRSDKSIQVTLALDYGGDVFITRQLPETLLLEPRQKIALKIAGTRLRESSEPILITAQITPKDMIPMKAVFSLLSEKLRIPMKAVFDSRPRYFTSPGDTITVPLNMQNYSASRQLFSYSIKDESDGLEYLFDVENLWLEAYESKQFLLKIFRNGKFKDFLDHKMHVEVYDGTRSPVLQSFVPVHSISSVYRMGNGTRVNPGEIALEFRTLKNAYQVSDLRYADKLALGGGDLSFQMRNQYYLKQGISQLSNSYLQWNNASYTMRLGEVYTSGELSNYGNGLYAKHHAGSGEHELWGILNSGFIFRSVPVFTRNKKAFGYSFTHRGEKTTGQYQAGYVDDLNTGGSGAVFHAKQYRIIPRGKLEAGLGASHEFSKLGTGSVFSLAAELLYRQQFDRWQLESNSRFTGGHYLGLGRGQQTVFAKARYLISGQQQLSFGQYWQKSNPEYFVNYLPRKYTYYRLFSEYALRKTVSTHTFSTRYQQESLGAFYFSGTSSLYSVIPGYTLDYTIGGRHFITVSGEIAFQKLAKEAATDRFEAYRLKVGWRYRNLVSRVTLQEGIFNLNHYSFFRPEGYQQAEWLTQYRLKLARPRLETSIQFGFYKEDFYPNIRSRILLDASYQPTSNLTLKAGITRLANFFWQQPEYTVGLVYRPRLFNLRGNKTVQIRAFHDHNGNTLKDGSEPWASSVPIQVAGRMLTTGQDGTIKLQNVPNGNYPLSTGSDRQNQVISVSKNTEITLPVDVLFKVEGRLSISDPATRKLQMRASRIITFRSAEGAEYPVVTEANGGYTLRLPAGKYTVSIQGLQGVRLPGIHEKHLGVAKDLSGVEIKAESAGRKVNYQRLEIE